jgi:hypothetical protein
MTPYRAQIYVGSDERMGKAERALEHSLRRNASLDVEIHWMRSGDIGFNDWSIGRKPGLPYSGGSWSTDFSCFQFAVFELARFDGRAIYLDVDMVVLGDIAEDWTWKSNKPWVCPEGRSEVSVIDCAAFRDLEWRPSLESMKKSGSTLAVYWSVLVSHGFVDATLPVEWNSRRTVRSPPRSTKYS